ncbi:3,4-dihydroxyphenylacetaldehyde synthase 2 [Anastrepha ludens]|uniref:3,4-dihydroxyphenylacetaldehyde synthase 2 n=1 Tax=Anastrepha ludens TaxID=28586 RepID=UPI0023B1A116|nr:3,4-dihydroxyphenylacetaldehyde synthase 2 [Anastrepha ludens]
MDFNEFRSFGNGAIDLLIRYLQTIRERDVLPSTEPRSIIHTLPDEMPEHAEHWQHILNDLENILIPALTHWQSPHFHAFYPSSSSMGSIIGELLIAGIGVLGFNWASSPACTELEMVVLDWLVKFLQLPQHFKHSTEGPGGGVIQGSASEAVLVSVIAAREQMVRRIKSEHPEMSESDIRGKLVGYASDQSNSCVEKAGKLAAIPIKLLPTKEDCVLRAEELIAALKEDLSSGRIPTICIATLGTTGTCAYDDITALASICQRYKIWLHVDAAYAGAALALDEYNHLRQGLDNIDSLNINLHKLLLVNYDCAVLWLKDASKLVKAFQVNRIYLQNNQKLDNELPDFRNWQISLGRRFRALKAWIAFRSVGAEGLRMSLRKHIELSERFEKYVLADNRFELVAKRTLGIVCFRVKGDNELTTQLLQRILENKKLYMVQAVQGEKLFLRFVICGMDTKTEDIDFAWYEIRTKLTELFEKLGEPECKERKNKIYVEAISKQISFNLHDGNVLSISEKSK